MQKNPKKIKMIRGGREIVRRRMGWQGGRAQSKEVLARDRKGKTRGRRWGLREGDRRRGDD